MRPLWSGSIAFALVNVPVKIFTAVKDRSIHFHLMSPNGACRLRQKLYCPETDREYDFNDTAKAYELSPDNYVLLDRAEIDKLRPEKGNSIDIIDFIRESEIDPIYFDRTYYLGPDKRAGKTYRLLREVMLETKMVALGKFVMRQKEHLCVIRPGDEVLYLDTLFYADEVLRPDEIPGFEKEIKGTRITPRELAMGVRLVDKMATHFEPDRYHDEFREAMEDLIQAKAKGRKPDLPRAASAPTKVIDLMEALKKSVAKREKPVRTRHRHAS